MYSYINGKITITQNNYVVIENNGIGYQVFVANPYSYHEDDDITLFIYQQIREDENSLYGFKTFEEKEFFLKLINVKGLGPKMALSFFSGDVNEVISAIDNDNINYLKKYPKIGDKVARQIILDLKGKLTNKSDEKLVKNDELIETLKALGYKLSDLKNVISKVDASKPIE